jgi:hypothetical protein
MDCNIFWRLIAFRNQLYGCFAKARKLEVSLIRIVRPHAQDTQRDPRIGWFVFRGEQQPAPSEISDLKMSLRFARF